MADDKVKRLINYRKRTYALLSMQASLEGSTIVDIVERAIEAYANPSIKEIINAEYGEWEERSKTKKSGRPKTKKPQPIKETVSENKKDSREEVVNNIDDESNVEDVLTDEERELLSCYK